MNQALFSRVVLSCVALCGRVVAEDTVTISNQYLTVGIDSLGAELQRITSNQTDREYIWHGDPAVWERRAPVMFPICVRLKDNEFRYNKKNYEMPMLGFAKDYEFELGPSDETSATFILESDASTLETYPFEFRLSITYRLIDREVKQEFTVENLGKRTMYFALGGHPAFVFPLENGKTKLDYAFTFPRAVTTERMVIERGLVGSKTERFLKNDLFLHMNDERVPGYGMLMESKLLKKIGIAKQGEQPFIEMDLGTFPYINLSMQQDHPFVCMEPMVGHHDTERASSSIDKKECMVKVLKGTSKSYWYSIIVHESDPE